MNLDNSTIFKTYLCVSHCYRLVKKYAATWTYALSMTKKGCRNKGMLGGGELVLFYFLFMRPGWIL
jgi:hypothetical protein